MNGSPTGAGSEDPAISMDVFDSSRPEGESEIPWKIPVASAIVGALAVAIFVIYAIVVGPTAEDVSEADSGTPGVVTPEPSDILPDGYLRVTDQIGARVESVEVSSPGSVVAVSTAVPGSVDPVEIPPLDVAYWEIVTPEGSTPMHKQYRRPGLAGTDGGYVSVAFPQGLIPSDGELTVYVVRSVKTQTTNIDVPSEVQGTITDLRIDLGDGRSVVVDSMVIAPGGGSVAWRTEGGMTARVDAVVTLITTDGTAVTLTPEYTSAYDDALLGSDAVPLPYQFQSEYRLVSDRDGDRDIDVTAVSVELRITSVSGVEDPVALSMDLGS
ncbi:MAG: hypothetical protein M3132_05945 [Actinomycetia bacterium]|nr:hypothetical protein [Actinomycetes bacterium]